MNANSWQHFSNSSIVETNPMSATLLDSTTSGAEDVSSEYSTSVSSTESTASPLSKANDNTITLDLPRIRLIETNQELHKYKTKLKSLTSLLSPIQLFNKFDLIIQNHHLLKKEYIKQWTYQQSYKHDLQSIINQNSNSTQAHKLSETFNIEIELFIQTMENIQFSIIQLEDICQQLQSSNSLHNTNHIKQSLSLQTNKFKYKRQKYNTKNIHTDTDDSDIDNDNDKYPVIVSVSQLKSTKSIKSYRRRSSMRSFGTLYSDHFRHSVAKNYKHGLSTLGDDIKSEDTMSNKLEIVKYYHDNYIGQSETFESPFGIRPIIYCDWTASGKPLLCIEEYINNEILPSYANTHTINSFTGIQTSKFRSESRSIILESLGGNYKEDVVIFTGSGATSAIYKLSHVLLKRNNKFYRPFRTVVFISIYEHNSNIFIWKELGCKIIVIPEDKNIGGLNLKVLEKHLKFYTSARMKNKYNLLIGSFSAASNVSGIINPIDKTTKLLHRYNALSFWDYATGGPYMDINMNNKDAIFLSPHKYIGGPGSCGILCAKKKLFTNLIPVIPGGGTIFVGYGISDGEWEYLENIEEREEGGTPNIIGSIRTSFVFMIKDHLTTQFIKERENEYLKYFINECKNIKNLIIMGDNINYNIEKCKRLPIISFLITYTNTLNGINKTKYLHYNFIAALMNDLFGIQGRGGCSCAGMYGKYVLKINKKQINDVVKQLKDKKNELARPGYFRINLHFTLNKNELKYIVNAIKFICKNGWLFLPLYDVDMESGDYAYREYKTKTQLKSLLDIQFNKNGMRYNNNNNNNNNNKRNLDLNKYLEIAENDILKNLKQYLPIKNDDKKFKTIFKNEKRIWHKDAWYWLPSELYENVISFIQ